MPIDAKSFEPIAYGRATRCEACGIGSIDPLPSPAEVPSFYQLDAYYTQEGGTHFAKGEPISFADRLRMHLAWRLDSGTMLTAPTVLERVAVPQGGRILDVGCGHGDLLKSFGGRGWTLMGLDPDPTAVAVARKAGLDVRIGGAEHAAEVLAEEERFDLITITHALEHCVDPLAALRSLRKLLKPDGTLVCEVPNCAALHFATFNIVSEMFDAPRHLWFFEPRSLRAMFAKAGFDVGHTYHHGFARHYSNEWRGTEVRIRERLVSSGRPSSALPPEHSRAESLRLLGRAAFADADRKYDCVGVFARAAN
jgi:2-polyprenyl-3-methyl-5-hydroxy-6-metoxy-1,4-benzoquinol methylase